MKSYAEYYDVELKEAIRLAREAHVRLRVFSSDEELLSRLAFTKGDLSVVVKHGKVVTVFAT